MENILISACLLGIGCRYDGTGSPVRHLDQLKKACHLIPVCPEILGGLPTPRTPSEIRGERVLTKTGGDVTAQFQRGAAEALKLADLFGCRYALLKERSPSCGHGQIYDGTFSRKLTSGDGVSAQMLSDRGILIFGESQAEELLQLLNACIK